MKAVIAVLRWLLLIPFVLMASCSQKGWSQFSAGRPCVKMTDIPGGGPFQPSSMYFCGDDANRYLVRQDGSYQVIK